MSALIIGVVGPCAAGKSTLITGLKKHGYQARHIAQEHSYVADMWRQVTNPDVLIFLDVSYPVCLDRRSQNLTLAEFNKGVERLAHARMHADFYLDTNPLTIEQVLDLALTFLGNWRRV